MSLDEHEAGEPSFEGVFHVDTGNPPSGIGANQLFDISLPKRSFASHNAKPQPNNLVTKVVKAFEKMVTVYDIRLDLGSPV